ncbi:MAG: TetR/AcrR family transcriptional regulator [Pseudomonadota bacterium]
MGRAVDCQGEPSLEMSTLMKIHSFMKNGKTKPVDQRTRDTESKRAALHEAAMNQFTAHGYEQPSMACITKEASVDVGKVYRFYDTKLALLRAMNDALEKRIRGANEHGLEKKRRLCSSVGPAMQRCVSPSRAT